MAIVLQKAQENEVSEGHVSSHGSRIYFPLHGLILCNGQIIGRGRPEGDQRFLARDVGFRLF